MGVAIFAARAPTGVAMVGVIPGVKPVPVRGVDATPISFVTGVKPPPFVELEFAGVSSHLERRLSVDGVGVALFK